MPLMDINESDTSTVLGIMKKIPLLKDLNEEDHKEILGHITMEYFPKDHVLFNEGEPGDCVYIIKRGMVRVFHADEDPTEEKDVAMLGDNDVVGEMALISDKPRNATVKTVEETEAFKLMKDDFIKLVSTNPNMASRISKEFLARYKINLQADNE